MIKTITINNPIESNIDVTVTGIDFDVNSVFDVDGNTTFPVVVARGQSIDTNIYFDNTLVSGDYSETATITTLNNEFDLTLTITATDVIISPNFDVLGDGSMKATFPLDGDLTELSGDYTVTSSNTPSFTTGKFGQALLCDGSTYVDTGINDNFNGQFFISLWFERDVGAPNPSTRYLCGNYDGSTYTSYIGFSSSRQLDIGNVQTTSPSDLNTLGYFDGNPHHLVVVYNKTTADVYLDNSLFETITLESDISSSTSTSNWRIGSTGTAGYYNNEGYIDNFQIGAGLIGATEVNTLYTYVPV